MNWSPAPSSQSHNSPKDQRLWIMDRRMDVLTHMGLPVQPSCNPVIPPRHTAKHTDRETISSFFYFLPPRIDCFDFLLVPLTFWCIKLEAYTAAVVHSTHVRPWRAFTGSGAGFKEESHHSISLTCGKGSRHIRHIKVQLWIPEEGSRRREGGDETGNRLKCKGKKIYATFRRAA